MHTRDDPSDAQAWLLCQETFDKSRSRGSSGDNHARCLDITQEGLPPLCSQSIQCTLLILGDVLMRACAAEGCVLTVLRIGFPVANSGTARRIAGNH